MYIIDIIDLNVENDNYDGISNYYSNKDKISNNYIQLKIVMTEKLSE